MAIDFTGVNFGQEKDDEIDFTGVDFSGVDFGETNEGSVGMDLAASFGKGSNLLLKSIGDVYGLASGNMDNWASRQGQSGVEYYEDLQSDELRRLQQGRTEAVGQADGFWDEAGTAVWETVKNPRLFATFLTEQIPMTIGPGAAGRVASGVSKAAGVGAAVGTGAALQGGSVGDEVYDNIVNMPEEVWQKNDDYQALLSEMAPEEAKESLALKYARGAATASGALSVGSQMVPGGIAIERVLSKGKGALPGGLLARVGKGFAGETAQEALEEGGGQFVGNVAERGVDPTQDLMEGVGESAGLGALGGGPFGALAGIPGGDRQQTLDNIEQEVTEKTGNPVDGAIARAEADLDLDTTDINSYINDELVEADRDTSGDIGAVNVKGPLIPQGGLLGTTTMPDSYPVWAPGEEQSPVSIQTTSDLPPLSQPTEAPDERTVDPYMTNSLPSAQDEAATEGAVSTGEQSGLPDAENTIEAGESTGVAGYSLPPGQDRDNEVGAVVPPEKQPEEEVSSDPSLSATNEVEKESGEAETFAPILTASGKPFKTEKSALASAKQKKVANAKAVPVEGGFGYVSSTAQTAETPTQTAGAPAQTAEPDTSQENIPSENNDLPPQSQEAAATDQEIPSILTDTPAKAKTRIARERGLKKGSPGYKDAVEAAYDEEYERALASLPFEEYQRQEPDQPEAVQRQTWEALREEHSITETPNVPTGRPGRDTDLAPQQPDDQAGSQGVVGRDDGVRTGDSDTGAADTSDVVGDPADLGATDTDVALEVRGAAPVEQEDTRKTLADVEPYVETMRGLRVSSLDGRETAVVDTVDNEGRIFVRWETGDEAGTSGIITDHNRSDYVVGERYSSGDLKKQRRKWKKEDDTRALAEADLRADTVRQEVGRMESEARGRKPAIDRALASDDPEVRMVAEEYLEGNIDFDEFSARTQNGPDAEITTEGPQDAEAKESPATGERESDSIQWDSGASRGDATSENVAPDAAKSQPVLSKSGKPFKGKGSATLAAKKAGIAEPEIVEVDGGFGYRAADSSPATESEADTARNTSTPVEAYGDESLDLRRRQDVGSSLEKELTDDDIASQPLSKIWPKQEVDAIEDTDAAAFATAVRDSIPAKPRKSSRKARWVEEVKAAREVMRHYQNNPEKVLELAKGSRALRGMLDRVEVLKSLDRSEWSRVGSVRTHPTAHTYSKSGEKVPAPQVSVEIDGRGHTVRGAKTAAEAIDSIKEKLASSDPKATSGMKFTVRGRPGRYFIHKDGDSERRPLATFDTTEAAFDYRKNNYDDLVKAWGEVKERDNVKKTDVRSKENRDRTGADYRQGRDISPQEFVEQFGLRHVDFGKWVKDGDGERQRLLNQTYDALMDLSNIVGIPPSAIGLEGNLIFTFGKRGSGSASAHFEAGTNKVINLTKTKGAGSLGHEWFHALDNYFQEKRGPHGADRENAFITYAPENFYRDKKTGQRIPEREFNVMAEGGVSERGRRFVMSRFDRDSWELVEGVRPEVAIKFAELVEALDKSPMKDRASVIDKGRSDGYWSRVLERAARSFENYLIAKMEENGYNNDFLANVVSPERFARNPGRYPYLLPEETAPVSDAFDSLFETIESDSDSGMLYSREAYVPADAKPKGVGKGTAQLAVNKFLKQYKGADDVNVVVARNYEEHFGQKAEFRTKGGYSPKTDTLYLFTDELDSVAELGETLRHEILVHKGLGMVEPAQLKRLLDTFYASAKDSPELAQIVGEVQRVEKGRSDRVKAEEILARIGQEKLSLPDKILNKLFLAIQRMLNSVGLGKVSARRQGKDLVYRIADAFAEGKRAQRRDVGMMNRSVAEDNGPGSTAWERAEAKGLDMSKEARMERARDMGFDTDKVWYHGSPTARNLEAFDLSYPKATDEGFLGNAVYATPKEFIAKAYARNDYDSGVVPFLTSAKNFKEFPYIDQNEYRESIEKFSREIGVEAPYKTQEWANEFAEKMQAAGYDGAKGINSDGSVAEIAIYDTSKLRSPDAAFDPDESDSANLMFSRTDDTFTPPVEERMASRWVRNRDWFIRKFQNKFIPVQRLEEAIKESGGNVSERDSVVMAEEAFYGKTENDLKTLEKRLVDPLIAAMNENDVSQEELDLFLIANHAKERNAYIASINDDLPDGGSGMTDAESDAVMRRFREEGKLDAVKAVAEKVYKITETRRRILEDAGLVDADYLAQFETPYENYVPLKGFAENESEGRAKVGRGFDIRGKEDMRAMGRRTMAESPTLHAIQDLTASAIRLRKNEVGQTFLRMVEANPNPEYWEVFTEDNPDTRRTMVNGRVKEQPISNMGMLKDDYYAVKRDGKEYFIKVKDKRVQDALQNVGPEQLGAFVRAAGKVTRFLSAVNTSYNPEFMISNMSRDIQTAVYNALAENELEDGKIKGAGKSLSTRMVKGVPKAMRAIWGESRGKEGDSEYRRYYKEFLADGAKTGYFDSKDIDGLAKELQNKLSMAKGTPVGMAKRGIKAVGDFVEDMNSAVENAVRLSGYIEARKAGVSRKKAASFAKAMTINFNAKGEAGSAMNAAFLFFNAAIQGNKNFLRAIGHLADSEQGRALSNAYTGKKLNAAQKAAGVMMGAGIALSLLNREMAGEDDDGENWYDKVPDYVRERNIVLMKSLFGGPEGEYYTIPLPYGYNIFYNLGDAMEGAMNGSKKRKEGLGLNLALSAINSFSPFGYHGGENAAEQIGLTFTPTIAQPLVEIIANTNHFGGDIYRENYAFGPQKADAELSFRSTKQIYKNVAEFMNRVSGGSTYESGAIDVSPDTLEHIAEFALGGIYRLGDRTLEVIDATVDGRELDVGNIPFRRKVEGEVTPYDDISDFYDARQEIVNLREEAKLRKGRDRAEFLRDNRQKLQLKGMVDSTYERLRDLNKRRDRIEENESLTDAQRDERLRAIERMKKQAVDRFNKRWNEAA